MCGGRGWHEGMLDGARRGEEGGGAAAPVAAATATACSTSRKAQRSAPTSDAFGSVEMIDGSRGALSSSTTEAPSATSEVSGRSSTAGRGDRSFVAASDAPTKRANGLRAASGAACAMPSRKRRASESLASPTLGLRRSARLLAQVQRQSREESADEVTAVHASERRRHSARRNGAARRVATAATGETHSQERCADGRKASVTVRRRQEISPEGVSPDEATATTTVVSASAPTATAVQAARTGVDAGDEPEPHTPPSDADPSQRVPPDAPLRRQRVPQPETHERVYAMLGLADAPSRPPQHAPRELSREQQTALLNDCADRLLLRRGKCTACGEVKPLRPSSDFCFNLECKIMCEKPG